MFEQKEKDKNDILIENFACLLSQVINAKDVTPEIKEILVRHYMRFQKSHNIDREWAQISSELRPYSLKMTLPRSTGELYLALNNRHLTLNEIVGGQALLTGLLMKI